MKCLLRLTALALWLAASLSLPVSAAHEEDVFVEKSPAVEIWFATDSHVLSHELTDEGPLFQRMVSTADGKLAEWSSELLKAFLDRAREEHPDAVVLAGDLTFNGERQSLLEICELLRQVRREGIPVLVIPGNHDISYPYARSYFGEQAERVPDITQEAFALACGEFGYLPDEGTFPGIGNISTCPDSFSYLYQIQGLVRILCLDTNTTAAPGALDEKTLSWARKALAASREAELPVICVTHQNVLRQSSLLYAGFVIRNEEEVWELLREGDVAACFSGHSHFIHETTRSEDGYSLTDYCTGSLSAWPLPYTRIRVSLRGEVQVTRCHLEEYRQEAEARFDECTRNQVEKTLRELTIPEEERQRMIDFAVSINKQYFSGSLPKVDDGDPGWSLWKTYAAKTFWYAYFLSIRG